MKTIYRLGFVLILVLSIAMGGCDSNDSPTAPEEDPPPAPTTTETFTGQITTGATSCHNFTTVAIGNVVLKITDLQPLSTLTVGLGIGVVDASAADGCSYLAVDANVRINETLLSTVTAIGSLCACVYDVGNVFPDITVDYGLEVVHP